ncbi:MAG: cytochrome C oxidase subunit IV [Gammaproteobacteria bacterium]|nr:cytochrome C oxidase subunit IV [Gammaproteobacteria bacterium]
MAEVGQQHPIKVYALVWLLLFVFSIGSYFVDYLDFQGHLRWFLIIVFMLLKAGFIVAIFMHMKWERWTLITAILVPPLVLLVLMYLLAFEAEYAWASRIVYFGDEVSPIPAPPPTHVGAH